MLYRIMPTRLQNVIEANHVAHDIGIRIGDAIAHTIVPSLISLNKRSTKFDPMKPAAPVTNIVLLPKRIVCILFIASPLRYEQVTTKLPDGF